MNETLLYIILGILYLVFTVLGRIAKKKQQSKAEEPWSLEDAVQDMQTTSEGQPEVEPVPLPPVPSDWEDVYTPYNSDTFNLPTETPPLPTPREPVLIETSAPKPKPIELPDLRKKPIDLSRTPSTVVSRLRDRKSAQVAVILSEVLGKPKGSRGFPRPCLQR